MALSDVVAGLSWSRGDRPAGLSASHDTYVVRLIERLGLLLTELRREGSPVAEDLVAVLSRASAGALDRVLTAPESAHRLMGGDAFARGAVGRFLADALRVELADEGAAGGGWSALGDFQVTPAARCVVGGFPPIDHASPYGRDLELDGAVGTVGRERLPWESAELRRAVELLELARDGIASVSGDILAFVSRFTKVILLVKHETHGSFASGSNGHFIGRSFLLNPHAAHIDEARIADAVVHEAIHSLLYMEDVDVAWFAAAPLYGPQPCVTSPWSGRSLPLWSFCQACFVWYGLAHFWAWAQEVDAFAPAAGDLQMRAALAGFRGRSLSSEVKGFSGVAPALLGAIDDMQERVQDVAPDVRRVAAHHHGP